MPPLPASETKHVKELDYDLFPMDKRVIIHQDDTVEASSTGRTVWLGAQVLAVYLQNALKGERLWVESNGIKRRKCCIDVGAGTGLLSLSLHHMGYNILSTDVNIIAEGILATNLHNNQSKDLDAPVLESRTLDWFVDPTKWNWKQKDITTSNDLSVPDSEPTSFLLPPFDFLVTSDSIYHPSLSQPLLRTLHGLSSLQISQNYDASTSTISLNRKKLSSPPIYLALENRDSPLIDAWLKSAQDDWGFKTTRVVHERLEKLIGQGKGGLGWEEDDWHSVEVYKLKWNGITRPEMIG